MVRVPESAGGSAIDDLPEIEAFEAFAIGPDGERLPETDSGWEDTYSRVLDDGFIVDPRRSGRGPGARQIPMGSAEDTARRSAPDTVVQPVLVDPVRAISLAERGHLFTERIARLTVDASSLTTDRRGIMWQARLRTGVARPWRAELSVHASPSTNLTVIELRPDRHRRRCASFVRVGVRAVDTLCDRLARLDQAER